TSTKSAFSPRACGAGGRVLPGAGATARRPHDRSSSKTGPHRASNTNGERGILPQSPTPTACSSTRIEAAGQTTSNRFCICTSHRRGPGHEIEPASRARVGRQYPGPGQGRSRAARDAALCRPHADVSRADEPGRLLARPGLVSAGLRGQGAGCGTRGLALPVHLVGLAALPAYHDIAAGNDGRPDRFRALGPSRGLVSGARLPGKANRFRPLDPGCELEVAVRRDSVDGSCAAGSLDRRALLAIVPGALADRP